MAADAEGDRSIDDELRGLLSGDLGDAPVECSADERLSNPDTDS